METVTGTQINTEEKEISIEYPRIEGWALAEAQEKWNKSFAKADFGNGEPMEGEPTEDTVDYYEVHFEVTDMTSDRLSILFHGGCYYSGAAHPFAYAFAHTIDMNTGDEITLSSLSEEQLRELAKSIAEGQFNLLNNNYDFSNEEIVSMLKEYYLFDENESLENAVFDTIGDTESTSGNNYFIKDGKTCIILEVNHALGDYLLLQFDI